MAASGASAKDKKVQTAIILNCAGPQVLEVYDNVVWEDADDKHKPDKVLEALEKYCNPRDNEVLESHRFWNIPYQEPFEKFLTELKTRAASCNFQEKDRMMRDKIVFTVTGKLQELLLRVDGLTLEKAVKICRAYEQSNKQVKEFRDNPNLSNSATKVNKVTRRPTPKAPGSQKSTSGNGSTKKDKERVKIDCQYCGYEHERNKEKCPAWGKTCDKCKGRNHFRSKCKKVHAVSQSQDGDDDYDDQWLMAVNHKEECINATLTINEHDVRFQLDSAADVNTISQKHVRKHQVSPTTVRLNMWNKTNLKPLGETLLKVMNPRTSVETEVKFVVVPNGFTNLLGLKTIQELGFITINDECFISQIKVPQLGDLGEATLKIDESVQPKVLPCRKIPLAIEDAVKVELDRLVEKGVLVPVTEPTEWVSQMAVVHKPNGKLRICIDPQPLNAALKREHYKLPVLDDVLPKLREAKVFSKLDVREAYWHVRLDEESSKLTTMITPFGRYQWKRLPFGLKVSSEIFQRKLDEALGDLEGVFNVVDDIVIAGCGCTEEEAQMDNQRKMTETLKRCAEKNIVLNEDKQHTGLTEIIFHGHRITKEGVKVDEAKVQAIRDMPAPTDVAGVKRLCGMAQYMSRFLPDLAGTLEPIRALTRKDTPFVWSTECESAFDTLKKNLSESPCLAYFDVSKEVVIQVDSSQHGIGAVLLQEGRPIEYASRALTPSERNWAQIEKEALSVLYGLERFDQYTYGRSVKVENDHKPLAAILSKPLSQAPKRLQDIMMRYHRYDVDFVFVKGTDLLLADTLSRAHLDDSGEDQGDRARIMNVNVFGDIPDKRLDEIRETTSSDASLQTVMKLVLEGWPADKRETPSCALPYFDVRDCLSVVDGILVKGEAVVIPSALRVSIKRRLHSAHLGRDSMLRRARGTVYWPNMASDIKQVADMCETCQEMKPRNSQEPLKQHSDGDEPWQKIGLDLFEIAGKHYLAVVDYYSNFIEIDLLTTMTSARVVTLLKKHFARYGIPRMIISDGGPQFASQEFESFAEDWGVTHVTSSPMHARGNGKAESAVKIMKSLLVKTHKDGGDPYEAMLEQRNTPRQDTGRSPVEMMFYRRTRSFLPSISNGPKDTLVKEKRDARKRSIKQAHDRKSRKLSEIDVGQSVFFQHVEGQNWKLGKVTDILGPNTYQVNGPGGGTYRRNRVHLRPTKITPKARDMSPVVMSRTHDVTPLILPQEVPQAFNPTTDTPVKDSQPRSVQEKVTPMNSPGQSLSVNRPRREIKPPIRFNDYVTK